MNLQPVILWTDAALFALLAAAVLAIAGLRRDPLQRANWRRVLLRPSAAVSLVLLLAYLVVGLADSIHFRRALPDGGDGQVHFASNVESLLDELSIPRTLTALGVADPDLDMLVAAERIERGDWQPQELPFTAMPARFGFVRVPQPA